MTEQMFLNEIHRVFGEPPGKHDSLLRIITGDFLSDQMRGLIASLDLEKEKIEKLKAEMRTRRSTRYEE